MGGFVDPEVHSDLNVPLTDPDGTSPPSPTSAPPTKTRPRGKSSIRLLFSPLQKRHFPLLLLGLILSICSGALPPIMTKVLGNAFDAYTSYDRDTQQNAAAAQSQKDKLMNSMVQVVWHLCVLAAATMVLSTVMISIWVAIGEAVAFEWRRRVYIKVTQKKMDWFDLGMGCSGEEDEEEEGTSQGGGDASTMGSGGLMAKFARETDDVRVAVSQQMGQLAQYLTTAIAALVLALIVNWSLTLVILASIPVAAILTGIVEKLTGPQLTAERQLTAQASGVVERSISAITTVKAFNAQQRQSAQLQKLLRAAVKVYSKTSVWWGVRLGVTTTIMFCMFVQGFWYGSHLVQAGKATPGQVMTVFWSSILVSGHIQQIIEALNVFEKGKISALGLQRLIDDEVDGHDDKSHRRGNSTIVVTRQEDIPSSASTKVTFSNASPMSPSFSKMELHATSPSLKPNFGVPSTPSSASTWTLVRPTLRAIQPMQRITPSKPCKGEIALRNIDFTYPAIQASSETRKTLSGVDMYFPAGESTFIVGGSGSGKSTVAQLLLRLYRPDSGCIELDEQDMRLLDPGWCRKNIASVDQHPIIFDLSVHDNIALGLTGKLDGSAHVDPTTHVPIVDRAHIIEACRTALLHDFVKELPQGYDTLLGTHGASLSGGQKQRLSIARARLRDPAVLILDEATSALDLTARTLVHAAVKRWRRGKTTIIITHDLSQVEEGDFLYLLKEGCIVEHGYREELEKSATGHFARLAAQQRLEAAESRDASSYEDGMSTPFHMHSAEEEMERLTGDVVVLDTPPPAYNREKRILRASLASDARSESRASKSTARPARSSRGAAPFRYQKSGSPDLANPGQASHRHHNHNRSNASIDSLSSITSSSTATSKSLRFDSKHSDVSGAKGLRTLHITQQWHANTAAEESPWLEAVAKVAEMRRQQSHGRLDVAYSAVPHERGLGGHNTIQQRARRVWSQDELNSFNAVPVSSSRKVNQKLAAVVEIPLTAEGKNASRLSRAKLFETVKFAIATTPRKAFLAFGLIVSVVSGAITPLFSFFLAKLLATLALPNQQAEILRYALAVLGLAFLEGIASFARFTSMEMLGEYWVAHLRQAAFDKVISQDRSWFDEASHSPQSLVTRLIKDAEDARNLIARSLGALLTVCAMVAVAIIWSMCVGWQLTLVGAALAPVYIGVLTIQSRIVAGYEARNRIRREEVSKRFYDMASNIRGIRSMALEPVFAARFYDEIVRTKKDAIRSAPFRGFGFGLGEAMTYVAEALMFYVGAVLIVKGLYDFERMVVVFNLIIFAVTFAGEILAYLPGLTQSLQATKDLRELYELPWKGRAETSKSVILQSTFSGPISFHDVHFAYPSRPSVPVLNGVSLTIHPGETVAIVGSSGCGKSTVAALLQRLYDPVSTPGACSITWGTQPITSIPVDTLRANLSLVSQSPDLFDMSIAENVAFGAMTVQDGVDGGPPPTRAEIIAACKLSCAHDFILTLPKGYDTTLGEGGSLLSGGQRQRIAIARALLRVLPRTRDFANNRHFVKAKTPAKVLILDEASSALDDTTRHTLLQTLLVRDRRGRQGREEQVPSTPPPVEVDPWLTYASLCDLTTVLITHKLDEMKRCDRIIVLDQGKAVQEGSFEQLIAVRGGSFARLASAGEWGA